MNNNTTVYEDLEPFGLSLVDFGGPVGRSAFCRHHRPALCVLRRVQLLHHPRSEVPPTAQKE
jgi:hypothetical protein